MSQGNRERLAPLLEGFGQVIGFWLSDKPRRRVTLYDHHPAVARTEGLPMRLDISPGGAGAADYRIVFEARGEQIFSRVDTLVPGPLGLFLRRRLLALPHTVRVYPDFAAVAKYALLATDHRLSRIGIRERRRRGEGLEFHQLREYREGDVLRQVDWKATSRLRKLISREYQDERDQQVLFLLDCSNRMRAKDGALSHFDEALNALLLLAHVALRQGDCVGSVSFGAEARVIAPRKGHRALNALLENLFDLAPVLAAPDYRAAAGIAWRTTSKRSLVLFLTNLRDEDGDEIQAAVQVLRRRHLVLVASLRESAVSEILTRPPQGFEAALQVAAAHQYLNARLRTLQALRLRGVEVLDVEPPALPVALVNRYLDIKHSGRL